MSYAEWCEHAAKAIAQYQEGCITHRECFNHIVGTSSMVDVQSDEEQKQDWISEQAELERLRTKLTRPTYPRYRN